MTLGTRRSRSLAAGLAVLAGLTLSGCGQVRTGTAATVDGEVIPMEVVQRTTQSLVDAGGAQVNVGEAQRATLGRMIFSRLLARVAHQQGVEVSQGEIAAKREEVEQFLGGPDQVRQALIQENVPPSYADEVFRDLTVSDAISQKLVPGEGEQVRAERDQRFSELLIKTSKEADIAVNPRFGTWDEQTGMIAGQVSGGLAKSLQELESEGSEGQPGGTPQEPAPGEPAPGEPAPGEPAPADPES
ncbi:MAG: SurA N-terminal domain-containing protein [Actinomycetota bacterium]|nr:SurA N-terminal domain-containing protein [Actinomycetota bacterium]